MLNLSPKLTAAGLSLFPNGLAGGASVAITHVAIGSQSYAPTGTETALKSEIARFPVSGGAVPGGTQVQVGFTIADTDSQNRSTSSQWIGEIGFYVGNTLLAVLSKPAPALFYKTQGIDIPIAYTLDVSALPAGAVTVNATASPSALASIVSEHEKKANAHPDIVAALATETAKVATMKTQAEAARDAALLGQNAGVIGKDTLANLNADLAHPADMVAWVTNDPVAMNNTTYRKTGASGAGAWVATTSSPVDLLRNDFSAAVDQSDTGIEGYLFAALDNDNKVGIGLKPDGMLEAKLPISVGVSNGLTFTRNSDGTYTISMGSTEGVFSSALGGTIDFNADTLDDIFTMIDRAGKVGIGLRHDGTLYGKIEAQTSAAVAASVAEVTAARGTRTDLDTRVSQFLNAYGMPKVHQWGDWYLRETRQRLRKRDLGESARLTIASIGDSWTHNQTRWTGPTESGLRATYGDAGEGWVGFAWGFGTLPQPSGINGNVRGKLVTLTGAWSTNYAASYSPDICQVYSSTAGDQISYTIDAGANAVKLFAKGGVGVIQYRFNAGAWAQIDLSALAAETQVIALAGIPAGTGILDIQVVSGTPVLFGIDVQKTTDGIRWHKLGATGSAATQWAAANAANWQAGIAALAPNLVTIMLGTNDQSAYTAAIFKGYVQTLINNVRAAVPLADILLVTPCENGRVNANPMTSYAAVTYELAVTNKCAFMDLQYFFGETFSDYASTSARAWFNADKIHPEPLTGGRVIADAITRFIKY